MLSGGLPIRKIPIAEVRFDRHELGAVERVLKSGQLRQGAVTEDFERRFARAVGARHAVAVNSGTAALFLAYRAMLGSGGEVIVPDFTFAATASMVVAAGGTPVFADVDPHTFNLDPKDVERKITRRTRALVPVHLFGIPANIPRLTSIARRHKLALIWDAAQAHGARFGGRDVGAFPDIVCYSFYPSKNMTTGEGGMLTTSDPAIAGEFRLLRSHGEDGRYCHVRLGFNYRMTDIAAALGRIQLAKLSPAVRRRRRNAAILTRGLSGIRGIIIPEIPSGALPSFNLFTIAIEAEQIGMSRDDFQLALTRHGVATSVHYPLPLHRQPIFIGKGSDSDFPISTWLAASVLSLPVHPNLSGGDLSRMIRAVHAVVGVA